MFYIIIIDEQNVKLFIVFLSKAYIGNLMNTVTISRKFQIVIPKNIRKNLKMVPGEKLLVIEKDGIIQLIPIGKLRESKGFLKKISVNKVRDENERFD